MKIAYVLGRFPVLSETFIGNEIRALSSLGHSVYPLALHRPTETFQPEDKALAASTLYFSAISETESASLLKRYEKQQEKLTSFARLQTSEPEHMLRVHAAHVADYVIQKGCTHIHAHFAWGAATYAIAAAKLTGLPVTITCHGSDVYARPKDLVLKCQNASAMIGVAPTITADMQKLSRTLCHTVYCGVDTHRFKPAAKKHARWLFAGRLIDCKGVDDMLAAWNKLPQDKRPALDIVGDGPDKGMLEAKANTYGLQKHVSFIGAQTSDWLAENGPHYRAFISSFKQGRDGSRDTAPMVLKEAMAMGLPIVTTRFIDIPTVVSESYAVLAPPENPTALAQAVLQVETLPQEKREAMGNAARKSAEQRFGTKHHAEALVAIWSKLKGKA